MSEDSPVITHQPLPHPVEVNVQYGLADPNDNVESPHPDGDGFQHSKPFPINGSDQQLPPEYNMQQPPPPAYVQPAPIPQGGVVYAPVPQQPPAPIQQTTTVVTQQPGVAIGGNQRARDWRYGLCCGCCCPAPNIPCWCSCLCYPFYMCYLVQAMNETPWIITLFCEGPFWFPLTSTLMRVKLRAEQNIHGSFCHDCFCSTVCPCMTLTQFARELRDMRSIQRKFAGMPMQQMGGGGGVTMVTTGHG
ncbi:Hypp8102 [Branchiostoma lanceolatum]|uniref:Hypp8102 protein n=1 Tax=Branchiostoma lanceolatum TaxID=7740 RepID=A0A8J9Z780_BRALA|nr:Hypp8102 [Branchiostoma lanceolatum]